jgi:MFS family permease
MEHINQAGSLQVTSISFEWLLQELLTSVDRRKEMSLATNSGTGAYMTRTMNSFVVAWACCTAFYFLEYVVRSAPAVMIPELAAHFKVSPLGVSSILGMYFYTYAATSLIAGVLLDRFGAKFVIPAGAMVLAIGCLMFSMPDSLMADMGRLLQGAGSALAFTGAVYLAAHGFPAQRLATAIGLTQCVGMLGGSAGQIIVGPLIRSILSAAGIWVVIGLLVMTVAIILLSTTPRENSAPSNSEKATSWLEPYKVVFMNPQSYLCGAVAGLLFAPTTILDMVWGVRFLQQDRAFAYGAAVATASMVPLGWAIGCPLLGWLADKLKRRKPALLFGASVMLACTVQLTYVSTLMPQWVTLLFFGIGSGAAMIPYTIIKEVNPDRVKGSATGAMNFLAFTVTAVIGPIFASNFGRTLGMTADHIAHLRHADTFWVFIIILALVLSAALRETGPGVARAHVVPLKAT